ncbi:MAG TPA: glycosyltransferase 87 family protein [Gaiellales bacterium]|nr:glycosyltransferase 87 family protein [Gaiellales bacterium]
MLGTVVLRSAARRSPVSVLVTVILLVAPVALAFDVVRATYGAHHFADFGIFYDAGRAVLHGRSPYPEATVRALRHQNQFVYPAFSAVVLAPLALLPLELAATILLGCSLLALLASLWLCGVRDWRCAAAALLSLAVAQGIVLGTITPLLVLAVAAAWRWRERPWVVAAALAGAIVAKVFLAPLLVWLLLTRRYAAAARTVLLSAVIGLGSWAVIGFAGLSGYPHLLSVLSRVEQTHGYSTVALCLRLGLGAAAGRAAAVALAAVLVLAAARLRGRTDGDARVLGLVMLACLAISPIVWLNYLMLVIPPLAVLRPRLSPAWLTLIAVWLFANGNSVAPAWKVIAWHLDLTALALVFAGVAVGGVLRGRAGRPQPA